MKTAPIHFCIESDCQHTDHHTYSDHGNQRLDGEVESAEPRKSYQQLQRHTYQPHYHYHKAKSETLIDQKLGETCSPFARIVHHIDGIADCLAYDEALIFDTRHKVRKECHGKPESCSSKNYTCGDTGRCRRQSVFQSLEERLSLLCIALRLLAIFLLLLAPGR